MYHSFPFSASFLFFAKQVQGVIKKKWQRFRLSRSLTNSRSRRRSSRTSSVFLSQSEVLFMVSFRNKVFNKRHQSRDYSHPINNQRCTCLRETNECIDCSKVQQYGWRCVSVRRSHLFLFPQKGSGMASATRLYCNSVCGRHSEVG